MLQPLATSASVQQVSLLLIPATLWAVLVVSRRHSTRVRAASFLAYVWHFQSALLLNIVAAAFDLWSFRVEHHLFYGVPVEFVIGQAILLGPVNTLLVRRFVWRFVVACIGLAVIYAASSLIVPNGSAWLGIAALAAVSVLPSLKVAEWTAEDRRVGARSALQSLGWVCLLFWLFPSCIFLNIGQSWQRFLDRPVWQNALILLPMLIPASVIYSAVWRFAVEGDGTGFPYDPPKRLVTGGVYAHVSNPMQVGIVLAMGWWGVVTASLAVSLSSLVAQMLFLAFKDVCNGSCAIGERDPRWARYQREVPRWIPRRTAWILSE